jgi:Ca-activated chloride channel family protein
MHRGLGASIGAVAALVLAVCPGCSGSGSDAAACTERVPVTLTSAPDTGRLLQDLADRFNASDAARLGNGSCVEVTVDVLAADRAEALLAAGWRDGPEGVPRPVIWSPGASTWATLLDQHRAAAERPSMVAELTPVARTPLVVALRRPLAEALGWRDRPIALADLVRLARADLTVPCDRGDAPAGLAVTVEEWCAVDGGPFRLGKANPLFSTSGLGALIVQAYAGTGKVDRLEVDDLDDAGVIRLAGATEAAVAHYGESPRRFLDNLYRTDIDDLVGPDVTAVVVEEKAVIDYNRGDPAGTLRPGATGTRPRQRLVAIYPAEGTVYEDNPLVVLDAPWVGEAQRSAARRFVAYVRSAGVQRRVLDYGFRPVEPSVEVEGPLFSRHAYGVDPAPAVPDLPVPDAAVLDALRQQWRDLRRPARVLLVMDVSGSMGDPPDIHAAAHPSKLELAQRAATAALDQFGDDDEVGLWVFSSALTGPGTTPDGRVRERVPVQPLGGAAGGRHRRHLANAIGALRPRNDTALYAATERAYEAAAQAYDPQRINAVVLLTDGHNEVGGTAAENDAELRALLATLSEADQTARPVPVFTIAYGQDADADVLRQIAEATNGAAYDSTDPTTIDQVFAEAVSNL